MTMEEQAASLDQKSIVALLAAHEEALASNEELRSRCASLQQQVDWFKKQLFGEKSERRLVEKDARQLALGEVLAEEPPAEEEKGTVASHVRRSKRKPYGGDGDLWFDDTFPVEEVAIPNPDLDLDGSVLVSEKVTLRLAQKPASYVILKITRPVVKRKDGTLTCPDLPPSVLGKSFADVSLLAGMVIDKLVYHLPLYRQHQRMKASGLRLARSTLTGWMHQVGDLLSPICEAQLSSILESQVLAMDETPIKAGRKKRGKMQTGYYWPAYGDRDEVVFSFSPTRSYGVVEKILRGYEGVLLSDGYGAYERYAETVNKVTHAQCWSHTRRHFVNAEDAEPSLAGRALDLIGSLYHEESQLRSKGVEGAKLIEKRSELCQPIVEELFSFLKESLEEKVLLPRNPFSRAAEYALDREKGLRVFLSYPNVPLDTNHLEREIRPIAIGRKNWMFCWTEIGAEYVGALQSLLVTCRLQGIDPYTYLVDVLQRVADHPAADVALLTPRLWKEHFAAVPLRSDLHRSVKNAAI